ncbi:MAG: DUF1206 domain-containing protein [Pseudonocardiales bacterium]|nr:MAG: DUF1206 domain-containing protein [Pseudonocardiales bacterium]
MEVAARVGLSARGVIYLMIGALILALSFGHKRSETDQRGAMQEIAAQSGGAVLILAIAVGLVGYALWRYAEAAFGAADGGKKAGPRLKSLGRALAYTSLASSAFAVFAGRHKSQAKESGDLSATVMAHPGGRVLVAVVGVVLMVLGIALVAEGVRRKFEKHLQRGAMSQTARKVVIPLGVVGTTARGAVFTLVGVLTIDAAVRFDPDKASGIDAVVRTLAGQPFGRLLLVVTALGLLAFGAYGLAEARWAKT